MIKCLPRCLVLQVTVLGVLPLSGTLLATNWACRTWASPSGTKRTQAADLPSQDTSPEEKKHAHQIQDKWPGARRKNTPSILPMGNAFSKPAATPVALLVLHNLLGDGHNSANPAPYLPLTGTSVSTFVANQLSNMLHLSVLVSLRVKLCVGQRGSREK